MPQYGLYEEESGKIRNLSKEEARTELNTRLDAARTTQEKQKRRRFQRYIPDGQGSEGNAVQSRQKPGQARPAGKRFSVISTKTS